MKYTVVQWAEKFIEKVRMTSEKALLYCGEYLTWKVQEQMEIDSYDTGQLASSITYRQVNENLVEVWTSLMYWVVREYGRKPWKFPPPQALVGWTARKWMIDWWATSKYENLSSKDRWTIYVIGRAIAIRWIEWKHTFRNVYNSEKQNVANLYRDLLKWL